MAWVQIITLFMGFIAGWWLPKLWFYQNVLDSFYFWEFFRNRAKEHIPKGALKNSDCGAEGIAQLSMCSALDPRFGLPASEKKVSWLYCKCCGVRGEAPGILVFPGLGISSRDTDSAHTGRFIRKRKGYSYSSAAKPRNQWLPAEVKAGIFYGCFNSGSG
jgi:hypothetical protein